VRYPRNLSSTWGTIYSRVGWSSTSLSEFLHVLSTVMGRRALSSDLKCLSSAVFPLIERLLSGSHARGLCRARKKAQMTVSTANAAGSSMSITPQSKL
jgi:hypothetical protein